MSIETYASSRLIISIDALRENYRQLTGAVDNYQCKVAGIVKANAYGLGIEDILPVLESENCPFYFVATPDEGLKVRHYTQKPVAVLNGLFHGAESLYVQHNLTPVLNSPDDLERWRNMGLVQNNRLPAILHFDTGMNRLGFKEKNHPENLDGITPTAIISHFACADEKDHPMTKAQFSAFMAIAEKYIHYGSILSLSNSSGLFRDNRYHFNMVRPGMALYGLNPTPETANPMNPVVSLEAKVLQVQEVNAGETVGYAASFTAPKNTKTATISIGYADGFLRSGSNKATLYWQGHPCPVLGRISMDLVSVDLGHISGPHPVPGDWLEVIGPHQSVDTLASKAGTIGYEILTSLGSRCERRVIDRHKEQEKKIKIV